MKMISVRFSYNAFLSYSTRAEDCFAFELEEFFEGFHQEGWLGKHHFRAMRICTNGSESRPPKRQAATVGEPDEPIKQLIRLYLERSAVLVILWPRKDLASSRALTKLPLVGRPN